jgi:hypothetical protein
LAQREFLKIFDEKSHFFNEGKNEMCLKFENFAQSFQKLAAPEKFIPKFFAYLNS